MFAQNTKCDEEIIEEVITEKIEADDDLDGELVEEVAIPDLRDVEGALEVLRNFSVFGEKRQEIQDFQNLLHLDKTD